MKKLLFVFLIGQLLLLSYIFNKSLFDIYELNNMGDSSLKAYSVEDFSGNEMNELYQGLETACIKSNDCGLQLVKTPVSKHDQFVYEIYHSDIDSISQPKSISNDTVLNYYPLTKEEFIDNNGVFYTDLPQNELTQISEKAGLSVKPYNNDIAYSQVINYNLLNFVILLLLTQLVLFIYTFTRIKINAIKKMMGYSSLKMVSDSLRNFLYMESLAVGVTLIIHLAYYVAMQSVVPRYFALLTAFLVVVTIINVLLLLITQISLRFIDISSMLKNKVYSNRLNYVLYGIKILLILAITLSISSFYSNYKDYQAKRKDLERYTQLEGFFTSNGYNADEDTNARKNLPLLSKYGDSIKQVYTHFDKSDQLYVNDAYITELLSEDYLETQGLTKNDIYQSIKENHIVANERYIQDFMEIKNENGKRIDNLSFKEPTIFVPAKFKKQEAEIKEVYTEQFNHLLNYNEYFGLPAEKERKINSLNIVYTQNDYEFELLGQSETKLKDTIVMLDQGQFGSLYYYDLLNAGDLYFKLNDREEFSQIIGKNGLQKLVNVGTLLTPYMDKVHFVEFVMYNALVFTILFLLTLIFVIYISNYVDIVSNSKRYGVQYIYGFSLLKTFHTHLIVFLLLLVMVALNFFITFNVPFYIMMLTADLLILMYLHNKLIKKDIHKIVKGG